MTIARSAGRVLALAPVWCVAGCPSSPSVLLDDGTVDETGALATDNADDPDPDPGPDPNDSPACGFDEWTAVAAPPKVDVTHATVLLADGRVLVTGGDSFGNRSARGDVWDPQTELWSPIADMPIGRASHRMVAVDDGTVLAIGGGDPQTRVDRWDPGLDLWSEAGSIPAPDLSIYDAAVTPTGGVLVVAYDQLFRSDDRGESWLVVDPSPRDLYREHVFHWNTDSFVFAVFPANGDALVHPVTFYDWSDDVWLDPPVLEIPGFGGYGDGLNAWGPLSDTKLAVVVSRPGVDPDPTPPAASRTHELRVDAPPTWEPAVDDGPWFGPFGSEFEAIPFWPGWLWVSGWLYDDETNGWCRTAMVGDELGPSPSATLLADGRILFVGAPTVSKPSAYLWSP